MVSDEGGVSVEQLGAHTQVMKRDDSNILIDSFSLEDVKRQNVALRANHAGPVLVCFLCMLRRQKLLAPTRVFLPLFTPTTCKGKIGGRWTLVARGEDGRSSLVAKETSVTRVFLFFVF